MRMLNFVKRQQPDDYPFVLDSWVLPGQHDLFKEHMETASNIYIAKPSNEGYGNGIFLFKTFDEYQSLKSGEEYVV